MIINYQHAQNSSLHVGINSRTSAPWFNEKSQPLEGLKDSKSAATDSVTLSENGIEKSQKANSAEAVSATLAQLKESNNPYANTILSAIESQLRLDISDGSTPEELQSRLESGLKGFLQGFDEGFEQVSAMPGMTDEINAQLLDTKTQVLAGLSALADELGLDKSALTDAQTKLDAQTTLSSRGANTLDGNAPTNSAQSFNALSAFASQENGFKFSLTTADGDKIEILASSLKAMQLEKNGDSQSLNASQSSQFSFSVDGDLDEGELKAINDLLNQVNKVSESFFSGNVEQAFDQALNMGFDSQEITGYALKMTQASYAQVQGTYAAPANSDAVNAPAPSKNLVHLGNFLKELDKANGLIGGMNQPASLIGELADKIAQARQLGEPKIADFINKLPASPTANSAS
ncbi:MAG: DUF5610 domain-containing protein [Marinagarivorans sp.]|nr:DUF5610 domain-containing protein [Marinagarivorans sp.]